MNRLLSCLSVIVIAVTAQAQEPAAIRRVVLPSFDSQVAARLRALDSRLNPVHSPRLAIGLLTIPGVGGLAPLLADPRNNAVWEQLVEDYHRAGVESGDALVTLAEEPPRFGVAWHSAQVRRLCHERLARLPRSVLEIYRQRVDAEAKALLAQGRRMRSAAPLRRLVDDLFCSSVGAEALDLLGDLAFERAEFDEAEHWWRLLMADPEHEGLHVPRPNVDLLRVRAKLILARMFVGRYEEAHAELARFRSAHPQASGSLAGQAGLYAEILDKTLATLLDKRIRNNDEAWQTFGGGITRDHLLSHPPAASSWEDGPAWRVKLPSLTRPGREAVADHTSRQRSLAFHPVIAHQQVLIADHRSVVSYHLTTGRELFRYDLAGAGLIDPGAGLDPKVTLPRFTLTVHHDRAYVRLGRMSIGGRGGARANYLVCLDLTQPERTRPRELWHIKAAGDDRTQNAFEGAPLVVDGRVYAALTRSSLGRTVTSIVCYDARGRERWSREVCEVADAEENGNGARHRHHLLTWAAGQIVYGSHSGAIVAVDAWTGQPSWGVRYPSRSPSVNDAPSPRDLAPCLAGAGRVFAAPLDSDRLFCLDAVSGAPRWELDGIEVTHLLGTAHGRLFAATRDGVVAIDIRAGRVVWSQPSEGRLPSVGRGLLAGSWLFWPTRDPLLPTRAVTLSHGNQRQEGAEEREYFDPSTLRQLPAGNWAFGEGCLVIAGTSELFVFTPPRRAPLSPRPQA